jgi:hypothetical protein
VQCQRRPGYELSCCRTGGCSGRLLEALGCHARIRSEFETKTSSPHARSDKRTAQQRSIRRSRPLGRAQPFSAPHFVCFRPSFVRDLIVFSFVLALHVVPNALAISGPGQPTVLDEDSPTKRMTAAGFVMMPTTFERRLISLLRRSSGFVLCSWRWCSIGRCRLQLCPLVPSLECKASLKRFELARRAVEGLRVPIADEE